MWQKKIFSSAAILVLALMVAFPAAGLLAGESSTDTTDLSTTESSILEAYDKLPLLFIENRGQVDEEARYYVTESGQTVYFSEEKKEAVTPLVTEEEHGYPSEEDLIEVMFAPDSKVRLRNGTLVDLATNALAGVDDVLKVIEWFEWYRTCDVPEEMLDEIQAHGENNTGESVYNLNNIYRLRIPMGLDVWAISEELEALPGIIFARPVPQPTPLTTPPDYVLSQGYLRPASTTPSGINADYAWTQPGGDGAGVTVYDLEYSWNYNHADITKAPNSQINPNPISDPYNDNNHGTAVIGELVSDNNGWGTTGICYGASLRTCGAYYGNSWNPSGAIAYAIADALSNQWPSSVILLEQQCDLGPTPGNQYNFVPSEWYGSYSPNPQSFNPVYAAIVNAVSNGIHVVEAGGNGNVDTDNLTWYGDSGAIIVGAGGAYPGGFWSEGTLERLPYSSYGSRFNLQGWGEDVVTTGYGDLYSSEGVNYWYTNTFAGTSSASPIVTGAVAVIEGVRLARGWPPLSPAAMRSLLVTTGVPQISPPPGNIGPRPDLAQALLTMPVPFHLTVGSSTGGSVTVSPSGPLYNPGTVVRLTATPNASYGFVNWTGDVGTIADVNAALTTITMSGNYSVTANFVKQYDLTTSSTEGGSVTEPGEGVFPYDEGTVVNLVAAPDAGYQFANWTGDVSTIPDVDDATTTITMNGDYSIVAKFEEEPSPGVCGCFIATAAYGTPMAQEIEILREFRDEYLLTNPVGKGLVDFYYRVSPPMAEFITEHPSLKPIVRAGLVPAVAMSIVAVNTTLAEKAAIIGLVVVSVALAVWATRRWGRGFEYTSG